MSKIIKIQADELAEKIEEMAELLYDTDPQFCVTLGVYEDGSIRLSTLHPYNTKVMNSAIFSFTERGGYAEDESDEEKLDTLNWYEDYLFEQFNESLEFADCEIILI